MSLLALILMIVLSSCAINVAATPIGSGGTSAGLATNGAAVSKEECKKNGWQSLRTANGQSFKNQGECVSYFAKD